MPRPFELDERELGASLDEMVDATFADLQSHFLVLPKGSGFIPYEDFQAAYEILKHHTSAFSVFTEETVWSALMADSLVLVVLRTILGMSPPEWAELARSERDSDVDTNAARTLDTRVRHDRTFLSRNREDTSSASIPRVAALVSVAVEYITRGATPGAENTVHRLAKADTHGGIASLQHMATAHVPYSVLLYERHLGRPFASHRDAVSSLVGDVMESAVEERLVQARISHRRTGHAERIPNFDQAPDFFVPDEFSPQVLIEAKIASDDGTARDKVARILRLAAIRDERVRSGKSDFELIACIDGRGFGARRADMQAILHATRGKVFTLTTLDQLISHTRLASFRPSSGPLASG